MSPSWQVAVSVLEDPVSAPPEWRPAEPEITHQRIKIGQTRIAERVTAVCFNSPFDRFHSFAENGKCPWFSPDLQAFYSLALVKESEDVSRFVGVARRIDLDHLHFDPVNSQLAQAAIYSFDSFLSQVGFELKVCQRVADAEILQSGPATVRRREHNFQQAQKILLRAV